MHSTGRSGIAQDWSIYTGERLVPFSVAFCSDFKEKGTSQIPKRVDLIVMKNHQSRHLRVVSVSSGDLVSL